MKEKLTVHINEEDLKEILEEYIEARFERAVIKVEIEVGMEYEDRRGLMGSSYPKFKSVNIQLGEKA